MSGTVGSRVGAERGTHGRGETDEESQRATRSFSPNIKVLRGPAWEEPTGRGCSASLINQ